MVNRHLSEEMVVDVEWSGFLVLWAKLSALTASSPADREVQLEKSELPVSGSSLELSMPPHSMAVLVIGNA